MAGTLTVTDDDRLTERGVAVLRKDFLHRADVTTGIDVSIKGDSHAEYFGAHVAAAAAAWGRPVSVDGIAGQQSIDMVARLGGLPPRVTIAGGVFPGSGSVAVTSIKDAAGTGIRPLRNGGSGTISRPATLGGVACVLRSSDQGVTYTLDRVTPGLAVPIAPDTPLVMGSRSSFPIILAPRNDVGKDEANTIWRAPLATILARYKALTEWLAPDGRFLLLSTLPWSDESEAGKAARRSLDAGLRDQHPQQFLDWAAFLRTDAAFTAANVPMTAGDQEDIDAEVTPRSFRYDTGHLNAAGYRAAIPFLALGLANA